jgi:hypothetical protein
MVVESAKRRLEFSQRALPFYGESPVYHDNSGPANVLACSALLASVEPRWTSDDRRGSSPNPLVCRVEIK